jgi:hypothetical protein
VERRSGCPQSASDVDLENPIPFVDVDLGEPHESVATDDVYENMQRSCLLFDVDNSPVPLILFYHIQFYEVGLTTGFIDLRDQGIAALFVAASDEHSRALFRKQSGGRATHAAVTAGDQRHLAFKPHDGRS